MSTTTRTPPRNLKVTDDQIKECMLDPNMTNQAAAAKLGVTERVYYSRKAKIIRQGFSPEHDMTRPVPDGYVAKGVSTYYNKDGKPTGQWVKASLDHERQAQLMREAVEAMKDEISPAVPVPLPAGTLANLLNCYVITDYHLGMKAWGEETGGDWDTSIAEKLLLDWFGAAIAQAPDAKVGVFAQLGDFLHFDGLTAVTPTSGHILDADTRFQKVIRVAIKTIRRIVAMLLQKHEVLHLIMAEGNHDIASSSWLRELFAALFADEPRIIVDTSPDPYYCVEFGHTSLFFHHGHLKKQDALETVLIAKFREVFGRTKYSYAHTGHMHHDVVRETNTMKLEQHRTLSAPDSHASRGGWLSGRDAKVITYSRDFGEVGRVTISKDMVRSVAK